jgi:glutaredoxin
MPARVVLWFSSCATTLKGRTDVTKIKHILDAKKTEYEEVDLSDPRRRHRRLEMLGASEGEPTLPQLHVNGRYIGTADDVQEFEDWAELDSLLAGVPPADVAAASVAAAVERQRDALLQETDAAPALTTTSTSDGKAEFPIEAGDFAPRQPVAAGTP